MALSFSAALDQRPKVGVEGQDTLGHSQRAGFLRHRHKSVDTLRATCGMPNYSKTMREQDCFRCSLMGRPFQSRLINQSAHMMVERPARLAIQPLSRYGHDAIYSCVSSVNQVDQPAGPDPLLEQACRESFFSLICGVRSGTKIT